MNPLNSKPSRFVASLANLPSLAMKVVFALVVCLIVGCTDNSPPSQFVVDVSEPSVQVEVGGHLVGAPVAAAFEEESESNLSVRSIVSQTESKPAVRPNYAPPDGRPPILAVQMSDTTAFGVPIGNFSDQLLLMRNDGAIQRIPKPEIVQQTVLNDRFRSIERNELSQQLRAEFGRNYLVKNEPPYLIVAKSEHINDWAQRFRGLQHSFKLYCTTHGLLTREIEFPLVAVVFGSRNEFLKYAHASGVKLPEFCVGYYFSDSNRILLYESDESSAKETQMTICHEATHQLAFNMGLHQRRASSPLWVIEGLATMFESPMLSGLQSREGKSLWPATRKHTWQSLRKSPESIQRIVTGLIQNDKAFESDFQNAYTVAWAMTTYLSQRRSQQFGSYLQKVGNLPPFEDYALTIRVSDFQSAFGSDLKLLTNKIIKHLETLE